MDKKALLTPDLSNIMVAFQKQIKDVYQRHASPVAQIKADGTPVTTLDLAYSELLEQITLQYFPNYQFYSEEKMSSWGFPVVVVDPLDGTREYIAGNPEWSISVGVLENKKFEGQGWIINPVTQEIFDKPNPWKEDFQFNKLQGEVSRSEWEMGLYQNYISSDIELSAVGSIAYKLGRLAYKKSDFVISLKPKNIWDIAAGTVLCQKAGLQFYSEGKQVQEVKLSYRPPLIWCHPSVASKILNFFDR